MNSYFNRLWNALTDLATQDATHYTYITLAQPNAAIKFLEPEQHYFRLRLVDMFLAKSRTWFTDWHPAVTSQVKLKTGGREPAPICRVAAPPKEALSPGVFVNYPMTDLLPYTGGDVEIQAGLLGLKGDSAWAMPIDLLQRFSGLISAPLSSTIAIAEQVAGGLNELVEKAAERVHLGFHQSFTQGGAKIGAQYHIIIGAKEGTYSASQLTIEDDRLRFRAKPGATSTLIKDFEYIVIAIDAVPDRADWRLPDIDSAIGRAKEALEDQNPDAYEKYRRAAIAAALASPDLVEADRTRVVAKIKETLKQAGEAYSLYGGKAGAVGAATLGELMSSGGTLTREQAIERGPFSLDEAFAK